MWNGTADGDHHSGLRTRKDAPGLPMAEELAAVCAELGASVATDCSAECVRPQPDPRRDQLLHRYRSTLQALIRRDARENLAELRELTRSVSRGCGTELECSPVGADALDRLETGCAEIVEIDPYADADREFKWFLAISQFFLDGLAYADRLLATQGGKDPRRWQKVPPRVDFLGLSASGRMQAVITAIETGVPHAFRTGVSRMFLPTLLHLLAHNVFPQRRWSFNAMFETTLGWIRRGGFQRMAGVDGPAVTWSGVEHVRNPELFDTTTWRTRHNVILACAHRFGFLDIPLFYAALRGIRLGIWADNSFYGPGVSRKMAHDRYSIAIRGPGCPPFRQS
ncbi:MAG: hypothetical protein GY842_21605, partial [bacterium]|nr:hypothetical protein [bacterium]